MKLKIICLAFCIFHLASVYADVVTLDLAPWANMGFEDEVQGDFRGGWNDHGSNDARNFPIFRKSFLNVPFKIVNPGENRDKGIVVFDNPRLGSNGVKRIEFKVEPATKVAYVNLLHCGAWTFPNGGETVGDIVVTATDGRTATIPVRRDVDVKEWWVPWGGRPKFTDNVFPAVDIRTKEGVGYCYVSEFGLPADFGEVEKVEIVGAKNPAMYWMLVGVTLTDRSMRLDHPEPEHHFVVTENETWKPWRFPAKNGVVKGSVLDYAGNIGDDPSGAELVRSADGDYYAKDDPEKKPIRWVMKNPPIDPWENLPSIGGDRVREATERGEKVWPEFIGKPYVTNSFDYFTQWVDAQADFGYNMLFICDDGFYGMQHRKGPPGSWDIDEESIQLRDWMRYNMKRRGMKQLRGQTRSGAHWRIPWQDISKPEYGNMDPDAYVRRDPPGKMPGSPGFVRESEGIRRNYGVKGRYTGFNDLNDPDVMAVLMWNEASTDTIEDDQMPTFRAWLEKKYGSIAALKSAWKREGEDWNTFADIPNEFRLSSSQANPAARDACIWLKEIDWFNVDWFERECRELGCKAPVVHDDICREFYYAWLRDRYDVLYMHAYFAHPMGWGNKGEEATITQDSPIHGANSILREFAAAAVDSKPYFLTEAGVSFWNRHRYEFPFALSAYAALNGYDGILNFLGTMSGPAGSSHTCVTFFGNNDPVCFASEFLQMHVFRGGAVKKSPVNVRLRFDPEELAKDYGWRFAPSAIQTRLALVFRFGLESPSSAREMGTNDVAIDRKGGTLMRHEKLFTTMMEDKSDGEFDLAGFIARMKDEGYLPKENRTDPANEIYESCTGELYLDAKRSLGVINTPRVQGVYGLAGTTYDELPDFKVRQMSANGALNVVGADGRPVRESKKLCVVYATNAMNRGMTFRDESCTALLGEWGGDVLYECGKFDVAIKNKNAAKLRAWAVDLTGARTEQLVTLHPDDETVVLKVDVASLYGGPAVFFELAEE